MKNAGVAVLAAVSARDLEKALETNKDMPPLAIRLSGERFVASYHAQSVERVFLDPVEALPLPGRVLSVPRPRIPG